ncbi:MAG TPA: Ig-like domain-containing protein, partial [Candidatus Paceibacterota bacterium]|nr:Ig-like domain-containing protein [Candidatus Paceibacterota bacterium]
DVRSSIGLWLKAVADPDVILVHMGTNDFSAGGSVAVVQDRLKNLIADLSALRPHAKILVASPVLRTDSSSIEANQAAFAQSLPQLVSEQVSLGRQVYFVDLHAALEPDDLNDGVHPKAAGYDKMADAWLPAITNVITPLGTADAPAIAAVDAREDLTHVAVKFSKPVEDAAAATSNFNVSGGVTVLGAELDAPSKRIVTLTTSPQGAGMLHTLSVSGVRDRTPGQHAIQAGSIKTFTSRAVVDGSFEANGQGWTTSGNLTVAGSAIPATNGTKLLVFNGSQATPNGSVSQLIPTVAGQKYHLEFDMGVYGVANSSQALELTIVGNSPLLTSTETMAGLGGGTTRWASKSFEFVADSSTSTVTFHDVSAVTSDVDLLLDDVRLNADPTPTLTVASSPASGVSVVVSPVDNSANGDGVTQFVRTYNQDATVNLTAPSTLGSMVFEKWQKDGVNHSTSAGTIVTMDASHTMTAVYKILVNGSFELGTPGDVGTLDGWTVTGNPFGYLSHPTAYAPTEGNRQAVFNGGGSVFNGVISQSFTTTPGQSYTLAFDQGITGAAGRQQRLVVSVVGTATHVARPEDITATGTASLWVPRSYTFVADSATTTLTLSDGSAALSSSLTNTADMLLDNVRVTETVVTNTAPTAVADSYSTTVDTQLVVAAAGVLSNDTDAESDPLTAVLNAGPSHGSLTLNADGSFTYTPTSGYGGADSFTYHANDGALASGVVTVSLAVNAASTAVLVNGGFEAGTPASVGSLDGWTTSGSQFGYLADATYTATEGIRLAVFNGGGNTFNGVISQSFATTPGQSCTLDLDMGIVSSVAGRKQRLQVTVAGATTLVSQPEEITAVLGPAQWVAKSYSFVADSATTTLTLSDASGALGSAALNTDLLLDNVRVTTQLTRTLAVTSSPSSGASITVTPLDLLGNSDGSTDFTRSYSDGATVNLTAPGTFGGGTFEKWQKNGVDFSVNPAVSVTMDANCTLSALYVAAG